MTTGKIGGRKGEGRLRDKIVDGLTKWHWERHNINDEQQERSETVERHGHLRFPVWHMMMIVNSGIVLNNT